MSSASRERIAEIVSYVTRLPFMSVPLFFAVGFVAAGWTGAAWAALCIWLTSGISLLYLLWLVSSGRVRDPGKISRGERTGPLWVVSGIHSVAWLLVVLLGAPAELRAIVLAYAISTVAFAALTPRAKLSLHAAGISGAMVCLLYISGPAGILFAAILPPVWWARRVLGRHTHPELALGALVGGAGTWLAFGATL